MERPNQAINICILMLLLLLSSTHLQKILQDFKYDSTLDMENNSRRRTRRETQKNEKDVHLLLPPGWLTHGKGEKRRDEMKLYTSSSSFFMTQVPEELCKGANEKEKEEFRRHESKLKALLSCFCNDQAHHRQ